MHSSNSYLPPCCGLPIRLGILSCIVILLVGNSKTQTLASCLEPSTHIWLSTSSTSSTFAETPIINSASSATVYVWARLAPTQSITDLSLKLASTGAIEFTDAELDNPVLGMEAETTVRRFEFTPAPVTQPKIQEIQGFTLLNQDVIGQGIGPATRGSDSLYDAESDAWRLGQFTFVANESTELSLQIGANGIQSIDSHGEITPDFGVIFGDASDVSLCAIDELEISSTRSDAAATSGVLDGSVTKSVSGSFVQADDAILQLPLGDPSSRTPWNVRNRALLSGKLELTSAGHADPTEFGTFEQFTLITAESIDGEFDSISLDDRTLFTSTGEATVTFDEGAGFFRTLTYSTDELSLSNYLALPGDFNLDREVSFADFLILSRNFGNPGEWMDGDATADGTVAFADFLVLSQWFGTKADPQPASGVPEPDSCVMLIAGFFVLGLVRRRRFLNI